MKGVHLLDYMECLYEITISKYIDKNVLSSTRLTKRSYLELLLEGLESIPNFQLLQYYMFSCLVILGCVYLHTEILCSLSSFFFFFS